MDKSSFQQMPFIWPDLYLDEELCQSESEVLFNALVRPAQAVFGVVSAIDTSALNCIGSYLEENAESKIRLVISVHPTCRTSGSDLHKLLGLVEHFDDRAAFRIFPEASLLDRSSNLLCLLGRSGDLAISMGPTENLGLASTSISQANLMTSVTAATFESCRQWFDELWSIASPIRPDLVSAIPRLVLPTGDAKAAELWQSYRELCLFNQPVNESSIPVVVAETLADVISNHQNDDSVVSPTEAIGVPKLDSVAESLARVFEIGMLVSIDKMSRIPPLEAPVKPEWFGLDSFRQAGMVRVQTSIKVAPFDEATLKKIDRLRRISGDLLPRYSFALADGVRWIPKLAIPFFESALTQANEDAKKLLGETTGENIESFLNGQRERIRNDAQRMYEAFHPGGQIPENAVTNIMEELQSRLDKTKVDKVIPKVAYSPVAFNPSQASEWSSPWGQAFALLKGVAEFPRRAMTDRFFWQGIRTTEDDLIKAMDVAGDFLVEEYGGRKAKQRAERDLILIKRLEEASADAKLKCHALWTLITTGQEDEANKIIHSSAGH